MIGDYVRDKDAVTAALLLTEMTAWYAARGMTLLDALQAIYEKTYGYYGENTLNLVSRSISNGAQGGCDGKVYILAGHRACSKASGPGQFNGKSRRSSCTRRRRNKIARDGGSGASHAG